MLQKMRDVVIESRLAGTVTLMSLIFAGTKFRGWLDTFLIFAGI